MNSERPSIAFRSVNRPRQPDYDPGLQRHHILPLQLVSSRGLRPMLQTLGMVRVGIHDFRRNGLLLPAREDTARRLGLPLHRGPHRDYNEVVLERCGQIERGWAASRGASPRAAMLEALMRFDLLQRALRRRLLDPARWARMPLNRHDPALDFSHLDEMAELLWSASQPVA